jgi:succinate dehydrogenase/fumarate reductase flavoprotein subunit
MTMKGALIAASVAGLFAAGSPVQAAEKDGDMVMCSGINACKGHSACAGAGNACAGKNGCKGKGNTKTTRKDCMEKGGKVVPEKKKT